jgi:alpha-glucosidase/alpha-D-xyloside xylohydrolase
MPVSRRAAIRHLTAAGAGLAIAPAIIRGQSPITVAGRPVEISIAPVSRSTVRISVRPIVNGKPQSIVNRGALVAAAEQRVASGDLMVRVLEGASPSIVITRAGRPVQTITLDRDDATVSFAIGSAQIFGLGEGGPQFDRRGMAFPSRNGQGGYQLRTHGGRGADPVARQPRGLGPLRSSTAWLVRSDRQPRAIHVIERRIAARCLRGRL